MQGKHQCWRGAGLLTGTMPQVPSDPAMVCFVAGVPCFYWHKRLLLETSSAAQHDLERQAGSAGQLQMDVHPDGAVQEWLNGSLTIHYSEPKIQEQPRYVAAKPRGIRAGDAHFPIPLLIRPRYGPACSNQSEPSHCHEIGLLPSIVGRLTPEKPPVVSSGEAALQKGGVPGP